MAFTSWLLLCACQFQFTIVHKQPVLLVIKCKFNPSTIVAKIPPVQKYRGNLAQIKLPPQAPRSRLYLLCSLYVCCFYQNSPSWEPISPIKTCPHKSQSPPSGRDRVRKCFIDKLLRCSGAAGLDICPNPDILSATEPGYLDDRRFCSLWCWALGVYWIKQYFTFWES